MWSRKDFCKLTNSTTDALRHYEKLKLIDPKRAENNYRVYGEEDYRRIKYIQVLQYAGFSLEEIGKLLDLSDMKVDADCQNKTTEIFENKIGELEWRVRNYQYILKVIEKYMNKSEENKGKLDSKINDFTDDVVDKIYAFLSEKEIG